MEHYLGNDLPNKNALKMVRLGDLTRTVKRGLSSYYLQGKDATASMINIKDIVSGRVLVDNVDRVSVHETSLLERSRIEPGDVIVASRGNFKAAVADDSARNFTFSSNLIALTLSEEIKPELIAAYFNSPLGQNMIRARASGATIKGLNSKDLLEILIPLPPLPVQESLSRYLTLTREYNDLLLKELELRQKLTDAVVLRIMR